MTTYPDLDNYEQLTDEVYKYLDRLRKFEVENDSEMAADDQRLESLLRERHRSTSGSYSGAQSITCVWSENPGNGSRN